MIENTAAVSEAKAVSAELSKIELSEINKKIDLKVDDNKGNDTVEGSIGTKENPRYIITRNESLAGEKHPHTGVEFEKKIIKTPSGEYIEGVFANFESKYEARISEEMYMASDKDHMKECNKQLYEAIEKDPKLKEQFTEEQIEQIKEGIKDGSAPDGYVWNHEPEAGRMTLVDSEVHAQTGHTGGRSIWGGGSDKR